MKTILRSACVFLVIISTASAALAGVVPRDQLVSGKTYEQWSAAWWQWVLEMPVDKNPLFDGATQETAGECPNGANGQSGPVWFLAGVINDSGTAVRNLTIPSGKYLFLPVINSECSTVEAPPWYGKTQPELIECATALHLGNFFASVDGAMISNLEG